MFFQCDLASGTTRTHSYIEEKLAVVGKRVKLKDTDEPEREWTILAVADKGITAQYLTFMDIANRKQREASDI